MGVKKPVKKKAAAKKKAKPRMKTAVCTNNDMHEVYEGEVDCPYCGEYVDVEGRDEPPETGECLECGKEFKIKWED